MNDKNSDLTPSVEQDERGAFESWAANKGHRFNEGDLQHCKTWAWAAWQARAALTSSGRCFFCGEPMDGTHEQDCPQANASANVAQSAEAIYQIKSGGAWHKTVQWVYESTPDIDRRIIYAAQSASASEGK